MTQKQASNSNETPEQTQYRQEAQDWLEIYGRFVPITILTNLSILLFIHHVNPNAPMFPTIGITLIVSFAIGFLITAILRKLWPVTLKYKN